MRRHAVVSWRIRIHWRAALQAARLLFTAGMERRRTGTRYDRHVGLRFSRNASIPSPASSSIMLRAITSPAYA
ncbi:hypothetical protein BamMC406_3975 [Burkholderia ambifaria MC40-6]|uniref:Uncharacterized protein n=1 Tax=Burkholderia ambifaria (strain MC40-6) TaxID=398577 RepID=B1Z2K4_BURA4|nr:hypothetical protein BamMC406_3975 [Burkholderia ambifaria MC40-6]